MTPAPKQETPATELENLNKQKQDLEKQIGDLKVQVLDEKEKQTKLQKLEDDKKKVEDQILAQTQSKESTLKQDVEKSNNPNPQALEIIKETWLYAKLQETFKDTSIYPDLNWNVEAKIDRFTNQINTTVQKYLESIFLDQNQKKFPEAALKSINTWIQFMLMDWLKNGNNNADFFSSLGKVDLSWFKNLFDWFLKTFWKWWEFLSTWKKITKAIDFLSLQPTLWDNAHKIPQLMNPYKFIELVNNQKLQSTKDVITLSLNDLWIQEWDVNMTPAEKDYLKKIAENSAIKNDPKTIKAIISALEKSDWFLDKRKDLAQWALDMMDKANGLIAPFEKMLWINMFDMLKPFKWVLNMILSLLWFSWWLDWLQRKRLSRKIEKQLDTPEKKDFISDSMNYFKDNMSKSSVKEGDSGSVLKLYANDIGTVWSDIKAKIPLDYNVICDSIKNNLKNPEIINPLTLQELGWTWTNMISETTGSDWAKTYKIDKEKFKWKEADFVKSYTNLVIPRLIKDQKFMKDINWQNEFWLAVIWWVVVDQKNIVDWIKTKAITPWQYLKSSTTTAATSTTTNPETTTWSGDITKDMTNEQNMVSSIIDKIEGGYYHPDMNISWMWVSWETMMWIDRQYWKWLEDTPQWKEFRALIDKDRAENPTLRKHWYPWWKIQSRLRELVWEMMLEQYRKLCDRNLHKEALDIIKTDWRLLFVFVYWTWNWAGNFQNMANFINRDVEENKITDTEKLTANVLNFRKTLHGLADNTSKVSKIIWIAPQAYIA